jgi:O-antigen biosynthesis protein
MKGKPEMNRCVIVIPVFNGYEFVKPCIESVLRNSPEDCTIVVVDDASTDQQTIDYLDNLGERVCLAVNRPNKGFVRTVNEAMATYPDLDVLLLNSDTLVPPGWVYRMQRALYCRGLKVAGVCALSNNATLVSVPNAGANNLPEWLSVDDMDRVVNETSDHAYPELPVLHGFCMLLSREALNALGLFDRSFGRGYGEETDWSLRARSMGWKILAVDDLYVWHQEHGSFGEQRAKLAELAEKIILDRYPEYPQELKDHFDRGPLRAHKMRIFDRLRPRPFNKKRIRVLYVLHNWGGFGGLEIYSKRLIRELDEQVEFAVLYPTREELKSDAWVIADRDGTLRINLNKRLTEAPIWVREFPFSNSSNLVERWFEGLLSGWLPDIVHFHHLAGLGSFGLPHIAKLHGCKVLLSLCDDFFVCPLLRLGGDCKKPVCRGDSECLECLNDSDQLDPHKETTEGEILKLLDERSCAIRNMGASCDRITAPSEYLKRTYEDTWGSRIEVLPLGIPVDRVVNLYHKSDKLRVGWIGAGSVKKGFGTFCDAARKLKDRGDIEWHVIAPVGDDIDVSGMRHVKFHGPFKEGTLGTWLQTIDVAVVAAMQNEAYGSIVDEVIAHGLPFLVADVPAIAERITDVCRLYKWGDVENLIQGLALVAGNHFDLAERSGPVKTKSFEANAADFLRIYQELTACADKS